jgi:hypothetical protein
LTNGACARPAVNHSVTILAIVMLIIAAKLKSFVGCFVIFAIQRRGYCGIARNDVENSLIIWSRNMVGMTQAEANELWVMIKENNRRLNECSRHRFNDPWPVPNLGMQLRCVNCGGEMRLLAISQYIRGFELAGRSGNEIWSCWSLDTVSKKD